MSPRFLATFGTAALLMLAAAQAAAEPVRFGARSLDIPAPRSFVPVGQAVPEYLEISQAYLPPASRLVEIYTSPEAKSAFLSGQEPDLSRYFQLQVMRQFDGKPLNAQEFAASSEQMEKEIVATLPKVAQDVESMTDQGNRALQEKTGSNAQLKLGTVEYLGVFRREPWGLFYSVRNHVQISGEDNDESGTIIGVNGVALINHQLMFLNGYADDTGPEARRWVEGAVSAWADAVRAANPDDPAVAATAESFSSRIDWGRVGTKALIGALIGGVIGLFFYLKRRS